MSPPPTTTPAQPSKHRLFIGILLGIVALGGVASFLMSDAAPRRKAPPKEQNVTILLPPPPIVTPPPPPPPKVEPPPQEENKMVEQEPVPNDEPPPEAAPEAPPADDFGGGNPNGNGPPTGTAGGNGKPGGTGRIGGGSKYGWYAAKVQSTITDALRSNASTRSAVLSLQVRLWADADGRITRATLVGSSGNPATDAAIKNQVLTGLQLPQAPPAGLPMPITLRITARKPAL
jgi:outer membrane biosynthesis protein TonB